MLFRVILTKCQINKRKTTRTTEAQWLPILLNVEYVFYGWFSATIRTKIYIHEIDTYGLHTLSHSLTRSLSHFSFVL